MLKILSFDLDKTILEVNSWEVINTYLGISKEEDDNFYKMFKNGEISYGEWLKLDLFLWKSRNENCSPEAILSSVDLPVRKDFLEMLNIVKVKFPDLKIGIISGAPDFVVKYFGDKFGLDFYVADNKMDFETGEVRLYGDGVSEDKIRVLDDLCLKYEVDINDCMHVGDGDNDLGIFKATGKGVTFNWCSQNIKDSAKYVISDFSELENVLKSEF